MTTTSRPQEAGQLPSHPRLLGGQPGGSCLRNLAGAGAEPGRAWGGAWGRGGAGPHLVVHDLAVGLHQRLGVKRRLSVEHLVHADAQRPPVALGAVPAHAVLHRLQDLRGDVVRGADGHGGLDLRGEGTAEGNPRRASNFTLPITFSLTETQMMKESWNKTGT